jgi:hypothetical protein
MMMRMKMRIEMTRASRMTRATGERGLMARHGEEKPDGAWDGEE